MLAGRMFEGEIVRGRMVEGRQHMKRGCKIGKDFRRRRER